MPPSARSLVTLSMFAALRGVNVNTVKAWLHRGQLPIAARDARGRRLIHPDARPRLTGATECRRHALGGLLATCGGPGKIRRVTMAERAADQRQHRAECACGMCLALLRAEREATATRRAEAELELLEIEADEPVRRPLDVG